MATKEEITWLKVLIVLLLMLLLFTVALSSVFYAIKSIDEGPAARPSEWRAR